MFATDDSLCDADLPEPSHESVMVVEAQGKSVYCIILWHAAAPRWSADK